MWNIILIYSNRRELLHVFGDDGLRRPACFASKPAAQECQRVISALITASHFEGTTLVKWQPLK